MGLASIVLGVAALAFMLGGLFLFWIPILGPLLAFGAPVLALAGCVTGGIGMSRARQEGDSAGPATAGLIVSIIAFVGGLLVAVTCGFCGALCTAATLNPNNRYRNRDGGVFWGGAQWLDASVTPSPFGPTPPPSGASGSGSGPPPAFPPPPMPSGAPGAAAPTPTTEPEAQRLEAPAAQPSAVQPVAPSPGPSLQSRPPVGRRRPRADSPDPGALPMPQSALPMPQGATRP